ncbi:MAG: glycosyltransferase family 2 protein [Panacagrimonas sp.]
MNPPVPATPRVRVLVVNYNSSAWLARSLESLRRQSMQDFEVVVVDNASTDGSFSLPPDDSRFTALPQDRNLGFAAANNLAARGAQAAWLVLLNPDAEASSDWLAQLLEEAEQHPDCVIFGSTQLRANDPATLDGTGDCLSAYGLSWRSGFNHRRPAALPSGEVFAACGAACMIRRDWFERLGGFDERFFCYMEDVDLCFRARLLGARVWQSSRAIVQHAGGVSGGGSGTSAFSIHHGYRNLAWTLMRCMPAPLIALSLCGYGVVVLLMLLGPKPAELRRAFLSGAIAGLRGWPQIRPFRQETQSSRVATLREVAGWLSWNPLTTQGRRAVFLSRAK